MQVERIVQETLLGVMHQKRLNTLSHLVGSAFNTCNMTLTALGRSMKLPIQEKSCIKRTDRFLGNVGLEAELIEIYKKITWKLLDKRLYPNIIVDWSVLPSSEYSVIRASLVTEGRALTLYEEVHPKKVEQTATVHRAFLKHLKLVLPGGCCPNVITDAGFQNPWFKEVLRLGWHYTGRVRASGNKKMAINNKWQSVKGFFALASSRPCYLGKILLAKSNVLETQAFIVREKPKGRCSLTKKGTKRKGRLEHVYSKSASEPLLIVTSLPYKKTLAKEVIRIYKCRMQIEEAFRDTKSRRHGFGLSEVKTEKQLRWKIYLLIIMVATFIAWLVGWFTERNGEHYHYQANTISSRRVLSLISLGFRVIRRLNDIMVSVSFKKELPYILDYFEESCYA